MRAKQVVAVVLISASTALATMWGYSHFNSAKTYVYSTDSGKVPANYAKFFEGKYKDAGGPGDFVDAASAAIPARCISRRKRCVPSAITCPNAILFPTSSG